MEWSKQLFVHNAKSNNKHSWYLHFDGHKPSQWLYFCRNSNCGYKYNNPRSFSYRRNNHVCQPFSDSCRKFFDFGSDLQLEWTKRIHIYNTESNSKHSRYLYFDGYKPCQWLYFCCNSNFSYKYNNPWSFSNRRNNHV